MTTTKSGPRAKNKTPRKPRRPAGFVYVLGCFSGKRPVTYVGWTQDVARRLAQHNAGKGARSTRGRAWVLLHSEPFFTTRKAMSREWHLKRDARFRKCLVQAHLSKSGEGAPI